jgi:hypothetical protein
LWRPWIRFLITVRFFGRSTQFSIGCSQFDFLIRTITFLSADHNSHFLIHVSA